MKIRIYNDDDKDVAVFSIGADKIGNIMHEIAKAGQNDMTSQIIKLIDAGANPEFIIRDLGDEYLTLEVVRKILEKAPDLRKSIIKEISDFSDDMVLELMQDGDIDQFTKELSTRQILYNIEVLMDFGADSNVVSCLCKSDITKYFGDFYDAGVNIDAIIRHACDKVWLGNNVEILLALGADRYLLAKKIFVKDLSQTIPFSDEQLDRVWKILWNYPYREPQKFAEGLYNQKNAWFLARVSGDLEYDGAVIDWQKMADELLTKEDIANSIKMLYYCGVKVNVAELVQSLPAAVLEKNRVMLNNYGGANITNSTIRKAKRKEKKVQKRCIQCIDRLRSL